MEWTSLETEIARQDLRSCLISIKGRLVLEHYREPHVADKIAKINSCTKSVLAALVCIAFDQGQLPGPSTSITEFFPLIASDPDVRKREISLEHLLTMTAGFDWTEFGGQNSFPRMTRSPDWIAFVLEQPLSDNPGARMEYNSGVSQLLSAILVQATGTTVARFAEDDLFGPLGIEDYKWETDPQGIHTGGFGLWLRPSDMLKFGQLYLQEGSWEDRLLISKELVARSVRPAVSSGGHRRGRYGWHWWTDTYPIDASEPFGPSLAYYFARGFGGQFIYVIPRLEIVVVLTRENRKHKTDVFRELIAPLLVRQLRD